MVEAAKVRHISGTSMMETIEGGYKLKKTKKIVLFGLARSGKSTILRMVTEGKNSLSYLTIGTSQFPHG